MDTNREQLRYVGENRYLTMDMTDDLETGQIITAVTWTVPTSMTLETGTSAISSDGKKVSARFVTPTAGDYRLSAAFTTSTPTEAPLIDYVIVKVRALPEV